MSHVAYDLQLADAMNDLQEQVKVENNPSEAIMVNIQGTKNIADLAIKYNVKENYKFAY